MIRFDNVTKKYPGTTKPALSGITLEVLRGEFVFLVGASGSGKSSCLRLILKEEKPTGGDIHVLGQDLRTISNRKVPYFRRNLGVVFQDFRLLQGKSVFANVAFTLQVIGKSRGFIQEAVPDVLEMVGLTGKENRLPHELSGGEQQRVAIARAVVNKPQILLADEPTGNLDPVTSAGIVSVLQRINAGGTTVVMATHEAGIVDRMQKRVIELVGGHIVRDERHGGYTTAIPVVAGSDEPEAIPRDAVAPASIPAADAAASASAPAPSSASAPAPAPAPSSGSAQTSVPAPSPAAASAPSPSVPRPAPAPSAARTDAGRTGAVPAQQHAAEQPPAEQQPQPTSAHPAHPDSPAAADERQTSREAASIDDELTEQLSLAERLGLRAAGSRAGAEDEQNVGPVK